MWVMMAASAGVMAQKEGFGYKFLWTGADRLIL